VAKLYLINGRIFYEDGDQLALHNGRILNTETSAGGAYTLTADKGTYTTSGQSANLQKGFNLSADKGTYTTTGYAANLQKGVILTAANGTYSQTGVAANLTAARLISSDQGTYSTTGQSADLVFGHRIYIGHSIAKDWSFDDANEWTLGAGWSIAAGTLIGSSTNESADANILRSTIQQKKYKYEYVVPSATTGIHSFWLGNTLGSTGYNTQTGTWSGTVTPVTSPVPQTLQIIGAIAFTGTVSSVNVWENYYEIEGQDSSLTIGRSISAGAGSYVQTGNDADLVYSGTDYTLTAGAGSYAQTGVAADLLFGRYIAAGGSAFFDPDFDDAGSWSLPVNFNVTGGKLTTTSSAAGNATALRNRETFQNGSRYKVEIHCSRYVSGSFYGVVAGNAALPFNTSAGTHISFVDVATAFSQQVSLSGFTLDADWDYLYVTASFYETDGYDAGLVYSGTTYTITCDAGTYTTTGQAAGLSVDRSISAGQGTYTTTGQAAALLKGFKTTAGVGSYLHTGQAAGLLAGKLLTASADSYIHTGYDATLTYSGAAPIVTPDSRSIVIASEARTVAVMDDIRTIGIGSDDRTISIQ